MTLMGLRYAVAVPLWAGCLGASIVGMALKFPNVHSPYLAGFLLVATVASYGGSGVRGCRLQPGLVLVLSIFCWWLSALKVRASIEVEGELPGEAYFFWFLPGLALFSITYSIISMLGVFRRKHSYGLFNWALPALAVPCLYWIASPFSTTLLGKPTLVASVAVALSLVYVLAGAAVSRSAKRGAQCATALMLGAALLLLVSLPVVTGERLLSTLMLSACARVMAYIASERSSRAMLRVSCIFQLCVWGIGLGGLLAFDFMLWVKWGTMLMLAGLCACHYGLCRKRTFVDSAASRNVLQVFVLMTVVAYAFFVLRIALHLGLERLSLRTDLIFQGGQSVLLSTCATILALLSLKMREQDVLVVAAMIALTAALKVFAYDFTQIQDLPLVASVRSFGVMAAVGSWVWSKWQRDTGAVL